MNRLPLEKRVLIIRCLVEGMSIRSTCRTVGVARNTVLKLLRDVGRACAIYQNEVLRDLPCRRVEVDEIWSFVYAKQKNARTAKNPPKKAGDVWTWVALCPDTKLVASWMVGDRTIESALPFMADLKSRLAHRVQLTSDGYTPYLEAVQETFGSGADYAMLVKQYGPRDERPGGREYFKGSIKAPIMGRPKKDLISTSAVERQNLTMRMNMKRFTRKTNAFSKKIENHAHAVGLHFHWYNACRIHRSIGTTPAIKAGIADRFFGASDIIRMVDDANPTKERGPYGPRK